MNAWTHHWNNEWHSWDVCSFIWVKIQSKYFQEKIKYNKISKEENEKISQIAITEIQYIIIYSHKMSRAQKINHIVKKNNRKDK